MCKIIFCGGDFVKTVTGHVFYTVKFLHNSFYANEFKI